MNDDCCVVCAEPLEWLAYASCGHREVCSKCVARLRFVMQDKRCVICQQQSPAVIVTRNLGSFTQVLPASEFQNLKVGPLAAKHSSCAAEKTLDIIIRLSTA